VLPRENAAPAATRSHAQRGVGGCEAAGLVPSKTSVEHLFVEFHPSAVADRRVKRLKRSVWASGHLHGIADSGYRAPVCWFVTLTYRPGVEWSARHMSDALKAYRYWCKRTGVACRYTWVAELQGRGAVHYHMLVWLPKGVSMPKWDVAQGKRAAFWQHGMSNTQKAKAGVGYLMKYLSKLGELTRFPKGLRLYGIGGLNEAGKRVRSWLNLPEWVKSDYGVGDVKRLRGALVVCETGELLQPAYRVSFVPGGLIVRALRAVSERFHSGPYSTWQAVDKEGAPA
jgi:hypothetical protein